MNGLDAKFLYSETPTAHMHTVKVVVTNVSDVDEGFSYDTLVEVLEQQIGRLPPFRRRVVPVPWGLGHPVWVEDPGFDLRCHVGRRVLDQPGDQRQLAAAVGEFSGSPLSRDRPLWEMLVIEGLTGGRMAVVVKLHHAVADGSAAVALLQNVVHGTNLQASGVPADDQWSPEPIPSRRQLLKMSALDHMPRWKGLPRLGGEATELRGQAAASAAPHPEDLVQRLAFPTTDLRHDGPAPGGLQGDSPRHRHDPQRCLPGSLRRCPAVLSVGPG